MTKTNFVLRLVVLLLALTLLLPSMPVQAAAITPITPQNAIAGANVEYCWELYNPYSAADVNIVLGWPADFDLSGITLAACTGGTNNGTLCSLDSQCTGGGTCTDESAPATDSEVSVWIGSGGFGNRTNCTTGTQRIAETAGGADQADRDAVVFSGTANRTMNVIFEDALTDAWIGIKYTAKSGNAVLAASSNGIYTLSVKATIGGVEEATISELIYIGDSNKVNISASVDPTLSLNLADWSSGIPNTCPFGTFDATKINTCTYSVSVATNAQSGFISYITSDGGLISISNELDAVSDGAVTAGFEEYGVATDGGNAADIQEGVTCPASGGTVAVNSTGLTGSAQSLTNSTAPIDSVAGTAIVCHAASISPITPAGTYSQMVTITAIGNF